jgi:hypothetical protein
MVIDDDHIEPGIARRRQRLISGGAAIDRQHQRGAFFGEAQECRRVGAVSFLQPVRDIGLPLAAGGGDEAAQERRRGGAVDVVIAEDADAFTAHDRRGHALGGAVHVGERARVRHQVAQCRFQERTRAVEIDAAPGHHPCHKVGKSEALRHGELRAVVDLAHQPALAFQRLLDAEERRFRVRGIEPGGRVSHRPW